MSSYFERSSTLAFRRATVPQYRDIRDRPTWELLDTLYWSNDFVDDPENRQFEFQDVNISLDGMAGAYLRRLQRFDARSGSYFYDGTRQMSQIHLLLQTNTTNSLIMFENMHIVGANNNQFISANGATAFGDLGATGLGLFSNIAQAFPPELGEAFTQLLVERFSDNVQTYQGYMLSVTSASGSWTGATNIVINSSEYDLDTLTQPVRIYRALN
jgi:hypothetical protein